MARLTTEELYKKILYSEKATEKLGISISHLRVYRTRFKQGKVTVQTMEKTIRKLDGIVVQQKLWNLDLRALR